MCETIYFKSGLNYHVFSCMKVTCWEYNIPNLSICLLVKMVKRRHFMKVWENSNNLTQLVTQLFQLQIKEIESYDSSPLFNEHSKKKKPSPCFKLSQIFVFAFMKSYIKNMTLNSLTENNKNIVLTFYHSILQFYTWIAIAWKNITTLRTLVDIYKVSLERGFSTKCFWTKFAFKWFFSSVDSYVVSKMAAFFSNMGTIWALVFKDWIFIFLRHTPFQSF